MLGIVGLFPVLWVLFLAPTTGSAATAFGSAVHDPKDFLITCLNGVTAAGLYFVVASGFTLIFGLMRVVNMAHGAFFLLGGYIALKLQRAWSGRAARSACRATRSASELDVPALVATLVVAAMGLVMQQVFLRWNQGQELRQALITIAISIILADQMLAHFGGVAQGHRLAGDVRQVREPARLRHPVHDDPARDPGDRGRDRRRAVAVAEPHAHGDGRPRRGRRSRDGLGARDQHPA